MSKPKHPTTPCDKCNGRGEIPIIKGLRKRRKTAGLTLQDMADKTGYEKTHVRQSEIGITQPREPFASRYMQALLLAERTKKPATKTNK